jgi:hypothetical protein
VSVAVLLAMARRHSVSIALPQQYAIIYLWNMMRHSSRARWRLDGGKCRESAWSAPSLSMALFDGDTAPPHVGKLPSVNASRSGPQKNQAKLKVVEPRQWPQAVGAALGPNETPGMEVPRDG